MSVPGVERSGEVVVGLLYFRGGLGVVECPGLRAGHGAVVPLVVVCGVVSPCEVVLGPLFFRGGLGAVVPLLLVPGVPPGVGLGAAVLFAVERPGVGLVHPGEGLAVLLVLSCEGFDAAP